MNNLKDERKEFEALGMIYPSEKDVTVEPVTIAGIQNYWITSPAIVSEVIVIYLHGGGFIYGSIHSHKAMTTYFAKSLGYRILFVEYSLAPEKPFPAALDETVKVISELSNSNPDFKFILMGDSCGGNLVMSTALKFKSLAMSPALAQVVISPWINLEPEYPSYDENEDSDPIITKEFVRYAASLFGAADKKSPFASPIYGDFTGLGPTLILVGAKEILRDDSIFLHHALEKSGCHSELQLFENVTHVWTLTDIASADSRKALSDINTFLRSVNSNEPNSLLLSKA
ncbi:MAG TPA: alpha/beta hydrolase [Cyclobacteriaceae bacterium]